MKPLFLGRYLCIQLPTHVNSTIRTIDCTPLQVHEMSVHPIIYP